jgi:hypothetical protein
MSLWYEYIRICIYIYTHYMYILYMYILYVYIYMYQCITIVCGVLKQITPETSPSFYFSASFGELPHGGYTQHMTI